MVFRRINPSSVTIPASTGFGAQADETGLTATNKIAFLAVFEVTQAQWTALGGGTPWTAPELIAQAGFRTGAQVPAWGIDHELALATLSAYGSKRTYHLDLPSAALWEIACRAGTTTMFPWGDGRDATLDVKPYAAVFETMAGKPGPLTVDGSRQPNAFGFYDMSGNLWEWVRDDAGWIRGGSWNDVLSMARSANRTALDPLTRHPLVGVRPVLIP
jgi:formylglycine-generating enzyme required for sulfatase activity